MRLPSRPLRIILTAVSVLTVLAIVGLRADARQLDCRYDSFGGSTDLVTFTPETDIFERAGVLAGLDTTAYDVRALVEKIGHPIRVSVNGTGNFSFNGGVIVLADGQSTADAQVFLMHEIGHLHDAFLLTDAERSEWVNMRPGVIVDTYATFGWEAWEAFYFDRPAEQFAFEFSRIYRPCSSL